MSVFGNLVVETGRLLGFGTLKNLLVGRYAQPRSEQKALSADRHEGFDGARREAGRDPVPRAAQRLLPRHRRRRAGVRRGDPQVRGRRGDPDLAGRTRAQRRATASPARSSPAHFIARNAARYRDRFGAVPEFRAALHCGEIVAGEIGDVRREIAYVGDTLNVAARLLDASKDAGSRRAGVRPNCWRRSACRRVCQAEPLPTLSIRGRERTARRSPRYRCAPAGLTAPACSPPLRLPGRPSAARAGCPRMPLGRKMMNRTSSTP